ncbi:hypothetical protein GCM10008905_19610 [Clostridium malenominatum]|uniref:HTH cro/C1-type domain-containing protein n=1 Tax=Clostridium malenominatum TaxID=1539 RepID=A0ABN1J051_9CLOT
MGTIETGKIISTIRKQKSMTQKDIAELLNVSDKAVSKWERGECYPEVGLLPELAFILEITIDELLTGKKADGEGHVGTENQLNRQFIIEDKNHNYIKGTIISFIVLAIALYWSLVAPYTIQAVSAALVLISFSIFYLYDKKYSDLLRYYKESKTEVDFPIIQASCRQFIISSGITVFIFVNLLSFNTTVIKKKYFILGYHLQYMLMGVTLYTFFNLFLFLKSNKNNFKIPLYFHIGTLLSIIDIY